MKTKKIKIIKYKLHNKYNVFTKVKNVIESCKTKEHLTIATAMLDNFKLYYKEDDNFILNILNNVRWNKLSELVENTLTNMKTNESK